MSVLIKGMDMPKGCASCPIESYECELWKDVTEREQKRHKDCPIEKVSDVPLTYKGEVVGWLSGETERNVILELTGISVPLGIIESEE